jgi:hypothetical protein
MPSVAKNERKVAMVSIAEIGEHTFGIGFELVAQQQQQISGFGSPWSLVSSWNSKKMSR